MPGMDSNLQEFLPYNSNEGNHAPARLPDWPESTSAAGPSNLEVLALSSSAPGTTNYKLSIMSMHSESLSMVTHHIY